MGFLISQPKPALRGPQIQRLVKDCQKCGGRGVTHVEGTENTVAMCQCKLAWTVTKKLEPFGEVGLERGNRPRGWCSPLSDGEHIEQSTYFVGPWQAVGMHMRDAVGRRVLAGARTNKDFCFRIITDHDLLHASFARPGSPEEAQPESHRDLVDPLWDLVIVRLGFLATKNINAPGVVMEALRHRIEQRRKPTWVVDEGTWGAGSPSWDKRVQDYIDARLPRIDITEDGEP